MDKKTPKTILIIASFAPSLLNFRGSLLREMVARGHTVIAAAPLDVSGQEIGNKLFEMGVRFEAVAVARGGLNPWQDLHSYRAFVKLLRTHRPDLVCGYTAKPVIYGGLAVRKVGRIRFFPMITGVGYAFTQGGGLRRKVVRVLAQKLYRRALLGSNAVIFQNPDDEALFRLLKLKPQGTPSICVRGSGVDLASFPPRPMADAPVFLMLARLVADKGVREYVAAAKAVKRQYPNAIFRLAGALDLNPSSIKAAELQKWVAEDVIEYLGNLRSVHTALAECRFYVLPSYREGTPRSVLEALATGRPVITTDAPGCRETVVHGKNGFLVPPKDQGALAKAMVQMIEMQPADLQKMANASVNLARQKFDVHKVNADILRAMDL